VAGGEIFRGQYRLSRQKADFERFTNLTPIGSSFIVEVADAEGNC
jgi:hypothetical protein